MEFKPVWLLVDAYGEVEQGIWSSEEEAFKEACHRDKMYPHTAPFTACEVSKITALKRYKKDASRTYEVVFSDGLRKRFGTYQEAVDYGNSMSNQGRIRFKVTKN